MTRYTRHGHILYSVDGPKDFICMQRTSDGERPAINAAKRKSRELQKEGHIVRLVGAKTGERDPRIARPTHNAARAARRAKGSRVTRRAGTKKR